MVHTKTIFTIAIILIIQAKGNEIVLHGQGKDGSYNEYRKSESSLPGGVSKTVVITRRMLGPPVNTLNIVSSSLGRIATPSVNDYRINLQPQSLSNQWNSVAPWNLNQQPASPSQWNLPYQSAVNPTLGVNLRPNSLPWNLRGSLDSSPALWNAQIPQSGSPQWYSQNNIPESRQSSYSGLLSQWVPQQSENINYNPVLGLRSAPGESNQENLFSQIGGHSNGNLYSGLNLDSAPGANLNLIQKSISTQQSPWVVTRSLNVGTPIYYPPGGLDRQPSGQGIEQLINRVPTADTPSSWVNNQVPLQGMDQIVNRLSSGIPSVVQASWGSSETSPSMEKRSTDEVEEDNSEGHWLKK